MQGIEVILVRRSREKSKILLVSRSKKLLIQRRFKIDTISNGDLRVIRVCRCLLFSNKRKSWQRLDWAQVVLELPRKPLRSIKDRK